MRIDYLPRALDALGEAPPQVRKAFFKQLRLLEQNLQHPPLRAKKYDEATDCWQARVNRDWHFYFNIVGDTYIIRASGGRKETPQWWSLANARSF